VQVTEIVQAVAEGRVRLLDTAPPPRFAQAHPAGAVNLPFGPGFAAYAATLPRDLPVVVFAEHEAIAQRAAAELSRLGVPVAHAFGRGLEAWVQEGGKREGVAQMTVHELARALAEGHPDILVLDVREPYEWRSGVVPGAVLISMGQVPHRLHELDPERTITVVCAHGNRSAQVSAWLAQNGFRKVYNVVGGMAHWLSAGHPVAPPALT
jgi:rhodanese-related sulfurtransferase